MLQNKILLSPDPLDMDVSDVDLSRPVIPAAVYNMRVKEAVKESNKARTGELIRLVLELTEPAQSTKGEPVNTGFTVTDRISITPTTGGDINPETGKPKQPYTVESIRDNVSEPCQCFGISGKLSAIIANPSVFVGKSGPVKITVEKETAQFPEKNAVQYYVLPKK